jgi:methylated-DNA-protein-cysteine methyltransferase-like protein
MAVKKKATARLKSIKPSGKRDENFFELVYEVARQIPRGRVTSYGAIARCLGTKMSARMVGWAMNGAGDVKPKVPAHRVVNRNGMLSGKHHFDPPDRMETLLKKEGVRVKNDVIIDFEKLFWDPAKGIRLLIIRLPDAFDILFHPFQSRILCHRRLKRTEHCFYPTRNY